MLFLCETQCLCQRGQRKDHCLAGVSICHLPSPGRQLRIRFLATLVALHLTPVSEPESHSFGLA